MKKNVFDKIRSVIAIILMSCAIIVFSVVLSVVYKELRPLFFGFLTLTCSVTIIWVYSILSSKLENSVSEEIASLNGAALDFFMNFSQPVSIIDENGKILWYNKSFYIAVESKKSLKYSNINDVAGEKLSLRRLREDSIEEMTQKAIIGILGNTEYEVFGYRLSSSEKNCIITIWNSLTRVRELEKIIKDKNAIVSYIAVDNYSETAGFMQSNYRTITAKISIILREWAESLNGILREVENDRYILIFEESKLWEITEKKFDILDTVREMSSDNVDIPVTISIGCVEMSGTLSEKEKAAHMALDLALQRGGDQAVLKLSDNSTEYFGGKTKTVQKRTKIRSRIVANEVMNLVKNASNVLIMGHRFPDFDSIGSCVGMARFAMQSCQNVNIVTNINDKNIKGVFERLSAIPDYKDKIISGTSAQDLVNSETLLIVTDVNNVLQFECPDLFSNVQNVVIIDHHRQTAEYEVKPKITYIEPSASSASEIVCEMIEQQLPPGTLYKEEAELLFAGMILDTKQFANNTGTRTFSAAQYLRGEGANPAEAQTLFRPELRDFMRELKFEKNVSIYKSIIAFSYIEESASAEDKIAAAKAADRLLGIEGVMASFVLCKIDTTVHISARSTGTVNVQLITEKLHGGGHFDMAGAQIKNSNIKDALVLLKKAIDEYLNEVK